MINPLRLQAHPSPTFCSQQGRWHFCRSLVGWSNTLRTSAVMAHAGTIGPETTVEEMRRSEGEGLASTQALTDDATIWASLHGLVQFSHKFC